MRAALLALASVVLLSACNIDLDRISLVKTPRVLSIVADPPEAAPGEDVRFHVLAFDPAGRELRYAYRRCIDPASFTGGITADEGDSDTGVMPICDGDYVPGTGDTFIVQGADLQQLYDDLPVFVAAAHLSAESIEGLVSAIQLPLQVRVRITAIDPATGLETAPLITAVKTFGLTTRTPRTTNPPYVFFSVGDSLFLGGVDPNSFECTLWAGTPAPVFPASPPIGHGDPVAVPLVPRDNPFDWEETYPYIDYARTIQTGHEGAYYSWFTTSDVSTPCVHSDCHTIHEGDETTTVSSSARPDDPMTFLTRDTFWELPSTPGTYHLWLVVRDGHLGESACHTTITVTP